MRLIYFKFEEYAAESDFVWMKTLEEIKEDHHVYYYGDGSYCVRPDQNKLISQTIDHMMTKNFGKVIVVKPIYKSLLRLHQLKLSMLDSDYIMKRYSYIDEHGFLYSCGWFKPRLVGHGYPYSDIKSANIITLEEDLFEL